MFFCFSVVRNKPPACSGLGTLAPEVVRALGGASVNPDRSDQKTEGAQDPLFLSKPLTVGVLHSPQAKQDSVRRRRTRVREPDPKEQRGRKTPSVLLVGVTRFELATSWSRTKRSTKLSHTPFFQKKRIIRERFSQMLIDYSTAVTVCQVFLERMFPAKIFRITEKAKTKPRDILWGFVLLHLSFPARQNTKRRAKLPSVLFL